MHGAEADNAAVTVLFAPSVCLQDWDDALTNIHFKAEGDVEFKALLFIPKHAPFDFYNEIQKPSKKKTDSSMPMTSAGLKLYVRRVFISDDVDELLPRWVLRQRCAVASFLSVCTPAGSPADLYVAAMVQGV